MLFGIRDKEIGLLMCIFTTHLLEVMHLMENKWPQLLEDLSTGRLSQDLKLAPEVRDALTKELKGGDPERAAELEKEFKKGFDGILSRIWPRLSFIIATDIINIKDQLARTYCKGIPIYVLSFNGSEGLYGVNLDPFSTSAEFVALINCCVFELFRKKICKIKSSSSRVVYSILFATYEMICHEVIQGWRIQEFDRMGEAMGFELDPFVGILGNSESNPDTLFIDEVEVGKKYEMVITGESGLYRYLCRRCGRNYWDPTCVGSAVMADPGI
ncbi:putative indole-3-acetic acid-amido synthetase GH3.9 [Apostichopus japonicus]|uniref:Putative indole-3-acetic acid-amido synthetase GH3.9 n=1 Tax=Stichopus japonicus TaxID=307972 RepID=A0A2G8L869_STIJA|nr:putative indole-3-acetic acid-amido synthetase GH3.9 [Apostichopus japonicus]